LSVRSVREIIPCWQTAKSGAWNPGKCESPGSPIDLYGAQKFVPQTKCLDDSEAGFPNL
jgi:hypothetical protein